MTNAYATPTTDIDYLEFEDLEHDNPRRETWVRVYVQVHNRGVAPATDVKVRAFWAAAGGGLPDLPADFWTAFPDTDPTDLSDWHPVGPARTVALLEPCRPKVVAWDWEVPFDAPIHSCLFAAVTSNEDGVTTTDLVPRTAVRYDNNVTLKNLHVADVIPGASGAEASSSAAFIDFAPDRFPFDIRINPGTLPNGARVHMFLTRFTTHSPLRRAVRGLRIARRRGARLPRRVDGADESPKRYNTTRDFVLDTARPPKDGRPGIYGIVPDDKGLSAGFYLELPRSVRPGSRFSFHIEHWVANRLVGGSSYDVRATKRATKSRRPRR